MVRITRSQALGEEGVASVLRLCSKRGWVGDVVRADYGEDIAFQTNYRGKVDPFRIYAQCKAFGRTPQRISASRLHFLKWLMMGELVVIFCYVQESQSLLHYVPNERMSFVDVWNTDQKKISISISEFEAASSESLLKMEWQSRIRGLSFLLSRHFMVRIEQEQIHGVRYGQSDELSRKLDETEIALCYQIFEFMGFLRISQGHYEIVSDGPLKIVLERIKGRVSAEPASLVSKHKLSLRELLTLAVLATWEDVSGLGMPGLVLDALSLWLEVFVCAFLVTQGLDGERAREIEY